MVVEPIGLKPTPKQLLADLPPPDPPCEDLTKLELEVTDLEAAGVCWRHDSGVARAQLSALQSVVKKREAVIAKAKKAAK